ncbi:MAG: V-type ATP synthase subunit E [Candidatus Micrarchaeia archaeon]
MNIDTVAESVLIEAKKEAESIVNNAKKEAEMRIELEKERLKENERKALEEYKKSVKKVFDEKLTAAHLESRKEIQKAKDEIVSEVIERVISEMNKLRKNKKEYLEILKKLYVNARNALGEGDLVVECSRQDIALVREFVNKGSKVTGNDQINCGIIVKSSDGRVIVDMTFEALVHNRESELRTFIYKKLFK